MKTLLNITALLFTVLLATPSANAQQFANAHYAIETTLDGKTPIVYEQNNGVLILNYNTNDLSFALNIAELRTGIKTTDSLLKLQDKIIVEFTANLGQGLFGLIKEENDDTYHKLIGTLTINAISYTTLAEVRVNNFGDKSNISKALFDFKLQLDPKTVIIPVLSNYFNNIVLFQMNDGRINQQ